MRVWEAVAFHCIAVLYGHIDKITSITFSYDDRYIMSGSQDCIVRMWNSQKGHEISNLRRSYSSSNSLIEYGREREVIEEEGKHGLSSPELIIASSDFDTQNTKIEEKVIEKDSQNQNIKSYKSSVS